MTIVATPGATDANSFVTLAEANAYHVTRLHNATWTAASDATKEAAILWAARLINREEFIGNRVSETQGVRWPRYDVWDADGFLIASTVVPQKIKNAQSELAFLLLTADRTAESGTKGFSEIKVGPIELKMDKYDNVRAVSPEVYLMLSEFINRGFTLERG